MNECNPPIFVGDIGTILRLTVMECIDNVDVVVDISSQTVMEIHFIKPDGSTETQTAVFTTDGINGQMQYVTILDDLDLAGVWRMQGDVTIDSGKHGTEVVTFRVAERLG